MPYVTEPLVPGDLYASAAKVAADARADIARLDEPAARAEALGRWWGAASGLGWPALFLPEEVGGAGGTLEDLVALVEGAGRDALPLPLAAACGVVPVLLEAGGTAAAQLASAIAEGAARICPVLDAYQGWTRAARGPRARIAPDGRIHLAGESGAMEIMPAPTGYLLACPIEGENEAALLHLPAAALAHAPRLYERLDGRPSATLDFTGTVLAPEALLARGAPVLRAVATANDLGAFLVCVEVVAALGEALARTVAYLSERVQFGVPLASFQALRHKVAELVIVHETLRAMVQHLMRAAPGMPAARPVALAKMYVGAEARRAAETIIQLHGGMGMTQELPASALNKRLLMAAFESGNSDWHTRRLQDCPLQDWE